MCIVKDIQASQWGDSETEKRENTSSKDPSQQYSEEQQSSMVPKPVP